MSRVVRRMLLTLIAGAAVTLAIAWGLPRLPWQPVLQWSPVWPSLNDGYDLQIFKFLGGNELTSAQSAWLETVGLRPLQSHGSLSFSFQSLTLWHAGWSKAEIIEKETEKLGRLINEGEIMRAPPPTAAVITSAGWPLECLSCIQWRERAAPAFDSWTPEWRLRGGFALGSSATTPTFTNGVADPPPVLPFTIAPGAFVIDSIVNGAIVAVLFAAFGAVRRRALAAWRTNRGRCPSCGYPTGAAAACTECGAKLKPAA